MKAPCGRAPLKRHEAICPMDANGRKPLAERRKPRWLSTLSVGRGLFLAGEADDHQKSLRFARLHDSEVRLQIGPLYAARRTPCRLRPGPQFDSVGG